MTKKIKRLTQDSVPFLEFISLALRAAGIGIWEFDPISQLVRWDKRCQELYGLSGLNIVPYKQTLEGIHPDDRLMVEQARQWASDTRSGGQYDIRFRTIGADTGQLRWIRCQGKAYFTPVGEVYKFVGIAQDVTQDQPTRQQSAMADELGQLASALSGTGVYRLDLVNDELYHSSAFAYRITGNASAKLTRTDFLRNLHPQDELLRQAALEQAARTGVLMYEPRFIWPDGTIYHTKVIGVMHRDELGKPAFIVGLVEELTQSTSSSLSLSNTEFGFKALVSASPVAMGVFEGQDMVIETANAAMYQLLEGDRELIGKPLLTILPHWQDQPFTVLLQKAYTSGETVISGHQLVSFWQQNQLINRHYTYHFTPLWDAQQNVYAVLATALDVSEQYGTQKRLEVSEARFLNVIEQAPMAIGLLKGRSMVIEMCNAKLIEAWGKPKAVIGLPIQEALPEIKEQGFLELLEGVFNTGQPYFGHGIKVELVRKKKLEEVYFDFVYTPLRDTSGAITSIMVMANEVTQPILAHKAVEASAAKLTAVLNAAPIAMCLYVGRNLVIEMANQAFTDIVGKGSDIIGKPLRTVMPELEGQLVLQLIDSVYTTGQPFERFGLKVDIFRQGVMTPNYYNISYFPLRNEAGAIYAVMGIGVDVTQEVHNRQALEASEAHYRSLATELAKQLSMLKEN